MKTCNSILLAVILLLHTSCHSSKNVASTDTADTNTIATSDIRVSSSKLDSAFSSMAIKLDSFDIEAEPVVLIKRDSTRSAVVAYRYHIKANSGTINTQKNAVSRSVGDTLLSDSIASQSSRKVEVDSHSESIGVYKPPDGLAIYIISIAFVALIIYIVIRYLKK